MCNILAFILDIPKRFIHYVEGTKSVWICNFKKWKSTNDHIKKQYVMAVNTYP